jgi:hypothetical protein
MWHAGDIREMFVKTEGKRPLGRPRRRWDADIKLDFKVNGLAGVN